MLGNGSWGMGINSAIVLVLRKVSITICFNCV